MGRSATELVIGLRAASTGYNEWRVQDPDDGSFCMRYSGHGESWCVDPERAARQWLSEHIARYPGGRYANFVVACVHVLTHEDRLMQEAASMIEELTKAPERLEGPLGRFTDQQVSEWMERHGLEAHPESEMRCAMGDAASLLSHASDAEHEKHTRSGQ